MEIRFIRHGPPEFNSSRWLHRADFKRLLAEYRESRMFMPAPNELSSSLVSYNEGAVVCSTLARSIDSACALGYSKAIQYLELDEASLPCPRYRSVPVPYQAAIIALRIAWFLGYSRDADSYQSTLLRAEKAARRLSELARLHGDVLVIGHGIMNKLICRKLREKGWVVHDGSNSSYWASTTVCFSAVQHRP